MKRKKKYIKPTSELIQIVNESPLASGSPRSLNTGGENLQNNKNTGATSGSNTGGAPSTEGDYSMTPGGEIGDGFAKVNPWSSWDEE